jgi:hypothetical protein
MGPTALLTLRRKCALGIFITHKNPPPSVGFEPVGPVASTLTTRPPRDGDVLSFKFSDVYGLTQSEGGLWLQAEYEVLHLQNYRFMNYGGLRCHKLVICQVSI